jgi:hypothetical protein
MVARGLCTSQVRVRFSYGPPIKEIVMPTVRYLDTSMYGSYFVDCEVLRKIDDDTFEIKFYDDVVDEYETKVVNRDRLEFPKFSEYMFF